MLQKTLQRQTLRAQSQWRWQKNRYNPFLFRCCSYCQLLTPAMKHRESLHIVHIKQHIAHKESCHSAYTHTFKTNENEYYFVKFKTLISPSAWNKGNSSPLIDLVYRNTLWQETKQKLKKQWWSEQSQTISIINFIHIFIFFKIVNEGNGE